MEKEKLCQKLDVIQNEKGSSIRKEVALGTIVLPQEKMHEVKITYVRPVYHSMPTIKCSKDVDAVLRNFVDLETLDLKEFFWVLLLTNGNKVLCISEISKGETTGTVVNLKEIFQLALKANATGIILCHNHPSGKLRPSKKDHKITEKINVLAAFHSFELLDHLIISSEGYYSFLDEGHILTPDNTLPF